MKDLYKEGVLEGENGRCLRAIGKLLFGYILFAALCVLLALPSCAAAQSTLGSIRGTAVDLTGSVVPLTSVTLHSDDENSDRLVKSDESGTFIFENVKPGKYSLHAAHDGFAPTTLTGVLLDARQDLRVSFKLSIAAGATTIEVSAAPDQINTEDAAISDSKNNALITQLPLNNRAVTTSPLGALTLSANVQEDSQGTQIPLLFLTVSRLIFSSKALSLQISPFSSRSTPAT